ncbi:MAG TPA: pyridoxamine 5'-phosphate oxidase family protein [Terriglobales bacterium]|nr:pyridoxamine 5'-phosphate oxidase family protein [Terriglobales bacterium]
MPAPPPSPRTQVRRLPLRGAYDRETVHAILDAGYLCHVAFVADAGHPVALPTGYGRRGDHLLIHGSSASAMLRRLKDGGDSTGLGHAGPQPGRALSGSRGEATRGPAPGNVEMCCTVTHLDGVVLARSVFHHSMNYRSVVIFGRARAIEADTEKLAALEVITNHIVPGRWNEARLPTPQELKGTVVLELPLAEASAKIRTGPPKDEEEDYDLPVWAGVVPARLSYGAPEPDPRLNPAAARLVPPRPR